MCYVEHLQYSCDKYISFKAHNQHTIIKFSYASGPYKVDPSAVLMSEESTIYSYGRSIIGAGKPECLISEYQQFHALYMIIQFVIITCR